MNPLDARRITGYHGTFVEAVVPMLEREFHYSQNDYDWLGDGLYFFQDAPARAREWARTRYKDRAAVVAAVINLDGCFDLLDIEAGPLIADAYNSYLRLLKETRKPPPLQTSGAHRIDRAVLNYAIGIFERSGIIVNSVRAAFAEGAPIFEGSALATKSHVQIAVRRDVVIEEIWPLDVE